MRFMEIQCLLVMAARYYILPLKIINTIDIFVIVCLVLYALKVQNLSCSSQFISDSKCVYLLEMLRLENIGTLESRASISICNNISAIFKIYIYEIFDCVITYNIKYAQLLHFANCSFFHLYSYNS